MTAADDQVTEWPGGVRTSARPATVFDDGRELWPVGRQDDGAVLALPGDVMTCPDGHPVLRIVAQIAASANAPMPDAFRRLDCDEPPPPGVLAPCPTCGCEVCPPIVDPVSGRPTGRYALFVNGELARARGVSA